MTSWATTTNWPTDLLRVGDLTCISLAELLDLAARMKSEPDGWCKALAGQSLACVLDGPSMRTRLSAEAAAHRLGMVPVALAPEDLELGHPDAIGDVARALSTYVCAVVARNVTQETLAALARAASVPVINVHSPGHHPCQALADLLTLREAHDSLRGLRVAYVGDGNNVARSLALLGTLAGMDVAVASPPGYSLEENLALAPGASGSLTLHSDPLEAVAGASAVYTDVWVSMGDETSADERRSALAAYRVDDALLDAAAPGAFAMHDLPAHPGEEISTEVLYGTRQRIWDQAENRRHAQKALLELLVTRS
jgi:ornithine carbamoyltransferase